MSLLEERLERLGSAFDQNTDAYDYSFKMVEAMQHVFQRALHDYLQNEEFHYSKNGLPDWHEYMKYYWLCQTMVDFATWLKGLSPMKEEGGTLLASPQEDAPIVFGGT